MNKIRLKKIFSVLSAFMVIVQIEAVFLLPFSSLANAQINTSSLSARQAYFTNLPSSSISGNHSLVLRVNDTDATVYFHIKNTTTNNSSIAQHSVGSYEYAFYWNTSDYINGLWTIEAYVSKSGLISTTATANISVYNSPTSVSENTSTADGTQVIPTSTANTISSSTADQTTTQYSLIIENLFSFNPTGLPSQTMLAARTNILVDSLTYKIIGPSSLTLTGAYDQTNNEYKALWDSSKFQNGNYNIEATANKGSQTVTKFLLISIYNQPTADSSTATTSSTNTQNSTSTVTSLSATSSQTMDYKFINNTASTTTAVTSEEQISLATTTATTTDKRTIAKSPISAVEPEKAGLPSDPVIFSNEQTSLPPQNETMEKTTLDTMSRQKIDEMIREYADFISFPRLEERSDIVIIKTQNEKPPTIGSSTLEAKPLLVVPAMIVIDRDGDGLPDTVEIRLGTNLDLADTDGDGYLDGDEVAHGYNPLGPGLFEKALAPVEKALAGRIPLEQPKISGQKDASDNLKVLRVRNSITTASTSSEDAEKNKLRISGHAKPDTVVTLFIYSSMPIVVTVSSDSNGNWIYELDKTLIDGPHEAYVVINDEKGNIVEKSSPLSFVINNALAVTNNQALTASVDVYDPTNEIIGYYAVAGAGLITLTLGIFFIINKRASS